MWLNYLYIVLLHNSYVIQFIMSPFRCFAASFRVLFISLHCPKSVIYAETLLKLSRFTLVYKRVSLA